MKTIINLFFIALTFVSTSVFSQDTSSQAQKITDHMKADLDLTDEQAAKVLPVNESFLLAIQPLRTSNEGKWARYRKFNEADTERDKALKSILTKEQFATFQERKKENRQALKDARKSNGS